MLNPDYWSLWTWIIGYAWFWRYHVGYVISDFMFTRNPDGVEVLMSMMLGTLCCLFWPITVTGRGAYVLWKKYGNERAESIGGFFPAPKEIESGWQKKQRKEREERQRAQARQREINAKERELGMKLTDW